MRRILLILLSLTVLGAAPMHGQNTSAQENRKAKLEKEIAMIEKQLKENASRNADALNTLGLVRRKVEVRQDLLRESEREIGRLEDSIAVRQARIDLLQARMDTMSLYFNRLVKNAYKNRDARVWYMYILASQDLGQASKRYGYFRNLSRQMNSQAARIKDTQAELKVQLDSQKTLLAKAEALKKSRQTEVNSLKAEEKEANGLVAQLQKEKNKYQKSLATKKSQVDALNKEIQRIIAAELASQKKAGTSGSGTASGGKKTSSSVDTKLAAEFVANRGKLPWPCSGTVLEHFGQHNHPVYKTVKMPFNNGVNIGVAKGTAVQAVFNGTVKKIIVMPGYNKCVLVQHGEYFTFYCKLGAVAVKAGDKVTTGQKIGTVDTIDGQTQLHFQIWKGSQPMDPETWLKP